MKKFVIVLCLFLYGCATQVQSTPTLEIPSKEALHLNEKVIFSVYDARLNNEENASEEVASLFTNAYKNSIIIDDYFSRNEKGNIYIKMRIVQSEANFNSQINFGVSSTHMSSEGTGEIYGKWNNSLGTIYQNTQTQNYGVSFSGNGRWHSATWINFELVDTRSEPVRITIPLVAYAEENNTFGYMTAQSVQEKSWKEAISDFTFILDSVLMTLQDENY